MGANHTLASATATGVSEASLLLKLILVSSSNGSLVVNISSASVDERLGDRDREFNTLANHRSWKTEVFVVSFILSIWAYSFYRFFKVWRDILNFSVDTLQRSHHLSGLHGPDSLWTVIMEYVRSLKKTNKRKDRRGSSKSLTVRKRSSLLVEPGCTVCGELSDQV